MVTVFGGGLGEYASALGKTANCQTLVSLTLARGEVPVVLALRLFLPESWTRERARLERAGVPAEYRTARTKPELALLEIECDRGRRALRLRLGGCRIRAQCAVPPGAHGAQIGLGGRHSAAPEGLLCRRADGLAGCQARSAASAARPRRSIDTGRRHAGPCQMAHHQLAYRHQGKAQGAFCCRSRASCRRTTAADQGQGATASPWGGSLARRRTPCVGEKKYYLANLPAKSRPAHLGGNHQGAMDIKQAFVLSPRDPNGGWWHMDLGVSEICAGRVDAGIAEFRRAIDAGVPELLLSTPFWRDPRPSRGTIPRRNSL